MILFSKYFPKAHSSVLPAEDLSLAPEYFAKVPWIQFDAILQDKH